MSKGALSLVLPADEARSTRRVFARVLKKFARDAASLPVELLGEEAMPAGRALARLLREFGASDPRPLYAVLRRPHLHVLLTCTIGALAEGNRDAAGKRAQEFVFRLLAELAMEGALTEPVRWPGAAPVTHLISAAHRVHQRLPSCAQGFVFRSGVCVAEGADPEEMALPTPPSESFQVIDDGMMLALADTNPISDFEAHPDKDGNQLDLGDAPVTEWVGVLRKSLELIGTYLPGIRAEMGLMLRQVIPVGTDAHKHLSASYREAIGTVYMTLHPQPMTMTEALIHEFQHNKLNALFHLDPVMSNAFWPLYPSPVRPDPRPLHGVLLAAHAFVPVAELYRRMRADDHAFVSRGSFMKRFAKIIGDNDEALTVLNAHAECSEAGAQVLADLNAWHAQHLALDIV
ncbi:MAG: aKG-HExxH-type peptide beta-hydroxylase [Myxococcota bacterium]